MIAFRVDQNNNKKSTSFSSRKKKPNKIQSTGRNKIVFETSGPNFAYPSRYQHKRKNNTIKTSLENSNVITQRQANAWTVIGGVQLVELRQREDRVSRLLEILQRMIQGTQQHRVIPRFVDSQGTRECVPTQQIVKACLVVMIK